jgi:hypothetical protein
MYAPGTFRWELTFRRLSCTQTLKIQNLNPFRWEATWSNTSREQRAATQREAELLHPLLLPPRPMPLLRAALHPPLPLPLPRQLPPPPPSRPLLCPRPLLPALRKDLTGGFLCRACVGGSGDALCPPSHGDLQWTGKCCSVLEDAAVGSLRDTVGARIHETRVVRE